MIATKRLVLRYMTEADTDDLLEIFSDPVAMKHFGVMFDRPRMEKWVKENLEHHATHGFSLMTVILKDSEEIIGDCGLETTTIDGELVVGIGFDFKRKYWNQGYATEAAMAVIRHGFTAHGLDKISGWIDPGNAPSQRVAEKAGMSLEKYVVRGPKKYALYSVRREDCA